MSLNYEKFSKFFLKNRILIAIFVLICALPFGLIITQYFSMRKAIATLLEYQDDYRSYAMTLKRVIREKTKNTSEENSSEVKKKIILSELDLPLMFPEDREIFSSDCDEPIFRVVNRNKRKLRTAALEYARKYSLEADLLAMFQQDRKSLSEVKKQSKKNKKVRKKIKKNNQLIQSIPVHLAAFAVDESDSALKHDFICQLPLKKGSYRVSSPFGPRKIGSRGWRFHSGIDLAAAPGTPVYAVAQGTVIQAGWYRGYGNCVTIAHGKKYATRYGHMKKVTIKVGTKVQQGTVIGKVSNTGNIVGKNGYHLHFEIHSFGKPINPLIFLNC